MVLKTGNKDSSSYTLMKLEAYEMMPKTSYRPKGLFKKIWSKQFYVSGPIKAYDKKYFSTSISRSLPFEGFLKLTADSNSAIKESNEADNTAHITKVGLY